MAAKIPTKERLAEPELTPPARNDMIHKMKICREGADMPREDKVCTRCVMDSTDPAITFDESGVCSFCKRYEEVRAHGGYRPGSWNAPCG